MYSTVFNEYVEERERLAAEEAERKVKTKQILKMISKGLSTEDIADFTDMPLPEIERMHQEYEATGTFRL